MKKTSEIILGIRAIVDIKPDGFHKTLDGEQIPEIHLAYASAIETERQLNHAREVVAELFLLIEGSAEGPSLIPTREDEIRGLLMLWGTDFIRTMETARRAVAGQMKTCDICKWWNAPITNKDQREAWAPSLPYPGRCMRAENAKEPLIFTNNGPQKCGSDIKIHCDFPSSIAYVDAGDANGGVWLLCGPKFGCCHWEEKETTK